MRQHGKVHVYSLFKEEVIVPMFDLHFRNVQVQGFWLTQWLGHLPNQKARQQVFDTIMGFMADGTVNPPDASESRDCLAEIADQAWQFMLKIKDSQAVHV